MKIFGIGLSKTGTTSLAHALEILDFKTKDYPGIEHYRPGDLSSIDGRLLYQYDAFTDTPIPSFFRELDVKYPGSKFILTTRELDGWLKSCKKQFTSKLAEKQSDSHNALFLDIYGCTVFDEQKFRKGYENHLNEVMSYFKERPNDLLILDIAGGDGWEKLCPFLGVAIPNIAFPKSNVTQIRWMNVNDVVDIVIQAGKPIQKSYHPRRVNSIRPQGSSEEILNIAKIKLKNFVYTLRGGSRGLRSRQINKAHKIVWKNLKLLTPQLPIISREGNAIPYAERRKWNHFWLVDTLDDDKMLLKPGAVYTIGIALIEDRKPILGVVYAPTLYTIYYAMAGKGAFKMVDNGSPIKIKPVIESSVSNIADHAQPEQHERCRNEFTDIIVSKAFSLCKLVEGVPDNSISLDETMEWHTAGANTVLNSIGMKIISRRTHEDLEYNKERFENGPISIEKPNTNNLKSIL